MLRTVIAVAVGLIWCTARDAQLASAQDATCQGRPYYSANAVCTPQGPYCPARPVEGQAGSFYFPSFTGFGNLGTISVNDAGNVMTQPLRCVLATGRIITREELGTTRIDYSVNPQYTSFFDINDPVYQYEVRNFNTYNLLEGTGQRSTDFWKRTTALRIPGASFLSTKSFSAGDKFPAWIAHLDINSGATWSTYDLEYVSQTNAAATPYRWNNQVVYTSLYTFLVRLPRAYAQGPVNSPYKDIPYGDVALYTHNGSFPVANTPPVIACAVNCGLLGPDFQCNLAGTKCECIPPLLPIMSPDGITVTACRKGNMVQFDWDWPVPQLAHRSNAALTDYLPLDNARGMCFTDISSALLANATDETTGRLAWCREYGGLSFTERCSGNGWHLQMRNRNDQYPTFLDMDCRCDSGWSGRRCHAPCYRRSVNESCQANTFHSCDQLGQKRGLISQAVCEPNFLFTIAPIVTLFVQTQAWVFQIDRYNFVDTPENWPSYCESTGPGTIRCGYKVPYTPTICYFDAATFRLPSSISSLAARPLTSMWFKDKIMRKTLCDHTQKSKSVPDPADPRYGYSRQRKFIPLEAVVLNEANYACALTGAPNSTVLSRNSSTNPCAYGTNPIVNPLHLNEPSTGPIFAPLNYNSFGVDQHIVLALDRFGRGENSFNNAEWDFYNAESYMPVAQNNAFTYDSRNEKIIRAYGQGLLSLFTADFLTPQDRFVDTVYLNGTGAIIFRCKGTLVQVTRTEPCALETCKLGTAGQFCEIICDPCIEGQHCNEGKSGDGKCVCDDQQAFIQPETGLCSLLGCGEANNLCSGSGTCITSSITQYCSCNAGFDGAICQNSRAAAGYVTAPASMVFDECDCSVIWADYSLIDRLNPMPAGLAVLSDYSPLLAPLVKPLLRSGVVNVGSSDQARQLCHKDALCAGFALHVLTDYWRQTGQPDPGITVYRAIFLYQSGNLNAPRNAGIVFPTGIAVEFHAVSRYDGYACASSELQVQPWYYNTYFATVQSYCQILVAAYAAANPAGIPLPSNACANTQMFISHWRYAGHLARLQPNPTCVLSPTLYSPESYCKGSRCPTNGNVPCSGVGVCSQDASGKYVCACEKFSSATSTGALGLNGNPRFLGNSCQFSVSTLCVQPQAATICSDNPPRCRPRLVFNSNFYNGDSLDVSNSTDYIPFCDCSGTNLQGTYCEQSRCGPLSGACKSLSASAGDCVLQNPSTQEYACVCQQRAIGRYCEIDASACLNPSLQLKCSAQGECLDKDVNHATPWCNCRNGAFGTFCENSDCPSDVMVPGHGICVNRQLQSCYDVYQGSRCEVDRCALFDGEIQIDASGLPVGCKCLRDQWLPRFQNTTVPSCWPQCPVLDGQMCGAFDRLPHQCNQNELNGQRYATCVCAQGYIEVPHPTLPNVKVCEKYCKNGNVPADWDPANPSPCICSANTGFDILNNSPRCDHPICANLGVYDAARSTCICQQPWSPFNKCQTNVCGGGNGVALWTDPGATSPFKCQCNGPYRPKFADAPFDCAGSACGLNGYLNPFYSTANSPASFCICVGRWRSDCSSLSTVCAYCATSTCLNGGVATPQDPRTCQCPTPYFNGPRGVCELNACAANNQTLSVANGQCVCNEGFQGVLCQTSICENQGVFNSFSRRCSCPTTAAGYFCEVLLIDYLPATPTLGSTSGQIAARSSSTGVAVVAPTPKPSGAALHFSSGWLHTLALCIAFSVLAAL